MFIVVLKRFPPVFFFFGFVVLAAGRNPPPHVCERRRDGEAAVSGESDAREILQHPYDEVIVPTEEQKKRKCTIPNGRAVVNGVGNHPVPWSIRRIDL